MSDDEKRIGELDDKLKQQDRRILELKQERDELTARVEQMREQVQDADDVIGQWIEAFDMVLGDDGMWRWDAFVDAAHNVQEKYLALLRQWNKFVPKYNAVVAPREIGRPLAASDAQQRQVLAMRKEGKSLRAIGSKTSLSPRTVRTIIGKADGTDRTSKRTNELRRLELNRANMASYRARKRTRDALPKQITQLVKRGRELVKRAGHV